MLSEIEDIKLINDSSFILNGVIQIKVNKNIINLAYPHKSQDDSRIAFHYLKDNYIIKQNISNQTEEKVSNRKSMKQINDEINALPCKGHWGTKKEIAELTNILKLDEEIKAITSGITDGNTWLIVCTNKRILMLDKGMIYGLKQIDISLDRINSISQSKGLLFGKIAITDGSKTRM